MATTLVITVDGKRRDLDLSSFRLSEADELLRLTGWTRKEWIDHLFTDTPNAIRFAWWLACKRDGEPLPGKFADVDFDLANLDVGVETDSDDEPDEPADPTPAVEEAAATA